MATKKIKLVKPKFKYKYHVGDIIWSNWAHDDGYDLELGREIVAVIYRTDLNNLLYATKPIVGEEPTSCLIEPNDEWKFIELLPGQKTNVELGLYISEEDVDHCEPVTPLMKEEAKIKLEIGLV
jgi:hypothetical protein